MDELEAGSLKAAGDERSDKNASPAPLEIPSDSTSRLEAEKIASAELEQSQDAADLQHQVEQLSVTPNRTPTSLHDLPDELFDAIAAFVPPADLRNLALVSRRWREPSHRHAIWKANGFEELMEFADLLLERPQFAGLVLEAHLEGNEDERETEESEIPYLPLLTTRAIHVIIKELPNLQELRFSSHIPHPSGQKQLMESIGQLECLQYADLGGQTSFIDVDAFSLALPAFSSAQYFRGAVRIDPSRALPLLQRCSLSRCDLYATGADAEALQKLLDALALDARSLEVCIEDDGWVTFITPAEVEAACSPYIVKGSFVSWSHFRRNMDPRPHLPQLPVDVAWVLLEIKSTTGPGRYTVYVRFWTGTGSDLPACIKYLCGNVLQFQALRDEHWSIRAGGRRTWGEENVRLLQAVAKKAGTTLEWC